MKIGFSIFLLAVGAILAFAVNYTVVGVNIHYVGWILMAAGALGLILTMVVFLPRERRVAAGLADDRFAPATKTPTSNVTPPSNVA
jgi:hypothetical protein